MSNKEDIRAFRRKIALRRMGIIETQERDKKPKAIKKGYRTIFIEAFKATKNIELAKKALDENGYKSDLYENKDFQNWIDEDLGR